MQFEKLFFPSTLPPISQIEIRSRCSSRRSPSTTGCLAPSIDVTIADDDRMSKNRTYDVGFDDVLHIGIVGKDFLERKSIDLLVCLRSTDETPLPFHRDGWRRTEDY